MRILKRPMSQVRGTILRLDRAATLALHFFGLSGIYDVLDADMRLGMQWESLFHDRKCRADFFHFEGFFWTLFTIYIIVIDNLKPVDAT